VLVRELDEMEECARRPLKKHPFCSKRRQGEVDFVRERVASDSKLGGNFRLPHYRVNARLIQLE
jgi:hypothetical protein